MKEFTSQPNFNVSKPSLTTSFLQYFDECLIKFKRRNTNKTERLAPMLKILCAEHVMFGHNVFVRHDSAVMERLKRSGFKREEGRCIFGRSAHTMFWDEFLIELEIVQECDWEDLHICINISSVTDYYNLNAIDQVLHHTQNKA